MAWYKTAYNDRFTYSLGSGKESLYHRCADLSYADINNPNREFAMYQHAYFIEERIEGVGEQTQIPSGIYYVTDADKEARTTLQPFETTRDANLFPFSVNENIIADFTKFIKAQKIYEQIQTAYKEGVLLFGPPGTGKTSVIQMIITKYAPQDTLVLYLKEPPCFKLIEELNNDSRLKILIFEELLTVCRENDMQELLRFLDVEISLSNTYIIASTNYPEKLPDNLTNRPGRFDELYKIEFLSDEDILKYLTHHLPGITIDKGTLITMKKVSIAQLKRILILMKRDKMSIQAALTKIKTHQELSKTGFTDKSEEGDLYKDIL